MNVHAYAPQSAKAPLAPYRIVRRDARPSDVVIDILYCGKHGVTADVEMIEIQGINKAYERMLKNDVKYRFVFDLSSLNS